MSENLTIGALRNAMQTVINATTTIWYGTDDSLTPGKVLMCKGSEEFNSPSFIICHPDDVGILPAGARHLREYAPTWEDLTKHRPISWKLKEEPFTLHRRLFPWT